MYLLVVVVVVIVVVARAVVVVAVVYEDDGVVVAVAKGLVDGLWGCRFCGFCWCEIVGCGYSRYERLSWCCGYS